MNSVQEANGTLVINWREYIYNAELISLSYPVYPITENYGESGELICIN